MALRTFSPGATRRGAVLATVGTITAGLLASLGAVLVTAGPAAGATTYFASPTGSGSSCTSGSPCTLDEALSLAGNGDTIDLEAGDYTSLAVGASGMPITINPGSAQTLTIQAVSGATVDLDGGTTAQVMNLGPNLTLTLSGVTVENGNCNTSCTGPRGYVGGGGIADYGTLTVSDSTFSNNTETSGTPHPNWGGGAIFLDGTALTVSDSTFSGNSTGGLSYVGGALRGIAGTMVVVGSSFSGNVAGGSDDDIAVTGGSAFVAGSMFASSASSGCEGVTDDGYNAVPGSNGCTSGSTGDVTSSTVSSDLGSLANNGGTTDTLKPTSGSAAVGAISNPTSVTVNGTLTALCPQTDQTGATSGSNACTIGSVFVTPMVAPPSSPPPISPTPTSTTLTASPETISPGGSVTLVTTVTSGSGSPSGTVTISSNGTAIPSCTDIPLNGGTVSCTTSFATAGSYQLTAAFNGTSFFSPSTSSPVTVTVGSAPPTTTPTTPPTLTPTTTPTTTPPPTTTPTTPPPTTTPTTTPPTCPAGQSGTPPNCSANPGYIVATQAGSVSTFGTVANDGSVTSTGATTDGSVVGAALTTNGDGYWLTSSTGGVYTFGNAPFLGSLDPGPGWIGVTPAQPVVGIQGTPDAKGYWLVARDGGVFSFGDATFYGNPSQLNPSLPPGGSNAVQLAAPVTAMAPTPDAKGYWLVGSDGGVFAFGDATYAGSANADHPGTPVVGIAAGGGGGYWEVSADGTVYSFGGASVLGGCESPDSGCNTLSAPIVSIQPSPDGKGYWLIGSDGGVFSFGDAAFQGSAVGETAGSAAV